MMKNSSEQCQSQVRNLCRYRISFLLLFLILIFFSLLLKILLWMYYVYAQLGCYDESKIFVLVWVNQREILRVSWGCWVCDEWREWWILGKLNMNLGRVKWGMTLYRDGVNMRINKVRLVSRIWFKLVRSYVIVWDLIRGEGELVRNGIIQLQWKRKRKKRNQLGKSSECCNWLVTEL